MDHCLAHGNPLNYDFRSGFSICAECEDLRRYELLMEKSDAAYKRACAATKSRDEVAFKAETKLAWEFADEAQEVFGRLNPSDQQDIREKALASMARGFVRGLMGVAP